MSYHIYIKWKKAKLEYVPLDNIYNSGFLRPMILELLLCLIMNYPFLYNHYYNEGADSFSAGIDFVTNDLLLCIMLFLRLPYWLDAVISTSKYLEPRSQRVCHIYGCDANNMFAVKAVMKADSMIIVGIGLFSSFMLFSYTLRLFER